MADLHCAAGLEETLWCGDSPTVELLRKK